MADHRTPTLERRRPAGRARGLVLAAALVSLLAACIPGSVNPPAGAGPLRYRDQVFSGVTVTKDLTYGSAPGRNGQPVALKLDLYQPAGDTVTKRPALVWAHGGGFSGGDKADDRYLVEPLVKRGFVVISINYRLLAPAGGCSGATVDACFVAAGAAIDDGKAAVRWLRSKAATHRIDTTRLGFGGFSAGAVMATGVGVGSDQPGTSGNPGFSSRVGAWVSASGGLPGGLGVDGSDSPGYLFHGTDDTVVPYQWSEDTATALQSAEVRTVLRTVDGGGHDLPDLNTLFSQSANFYYRELDLARAAR